MASPFATLILAFHALALVIGVAVLLVLRRQSAAILGQRKLVDGVRLNRTIMGWMYVQSMTAMFLVMISPGRGLSYNDALVTLVLPALVILVLYRLGIAWAIVPLGYWKTAEDYRKLIGEHLLIAALFTATAFAVFHVVYRESLLGPMIGLLAAMGGTVYVSRRGTRLAKGVAIDESLPLRAETDRLLEGFGVRNRPLIVRAYSSDGPEANDVANAVAISLWIKNLDATRPWIPMVLLQRLEPDAVVAILAIAIARKRPWGGSRIADFLVYLDRFKRVFTIAVAVLVMIPIVTTGWRTKPFLLAIPALAVLGLLLLLLAACLSFAVRRSDTRKHLDAFTGWTHADPDAPRTPVDFIQAQVAFNRLLIPSGTPEMLLNAVLQAPHVIGFLKELKLDPAELREQVLAGDLAAAP